MDSSQSLDSIVRREARPLQSDIRLGEKTLRRLEQTTDTVIIALLLVIATGGVVDLILDAPERWVTPHVAFEIVLVGTSLGVAIYLLRALRSAARSLAETEAALASRRAERDAWRRSARTFLTGLGQAIDERFDAWGLTPAERQVALLLIKGMSHKEIAAATGRSERTARQHAVAAYRKAGVSGRAELAAFFLEDLMLPDAETGSPTRP